MAAHRPRPKAIGVFDEYEDESDDQSTPNAQ